MKIFNPIRENWTYSKLIFVLNSQKLSATDLSRLLKKERALTSKQLKFLREKGYVNIEQGKGYNRKLFSVNWKKINEEFLNFLIKKNQEFFASSFISKDKLSKKDKNTELYFALKDKPLITGYLSSIGAEHIKITFILKNKKFQENLIPNPFLTEIFQSNFKFLSQIDKKYTLNDVFKNFNFKSSKKIKSKNKFIKNLYNIQKIIDFFNKNNFFDYIFKKRLFELNRIVKNYKPNKLIKWLSKK